MFASTTIVALGYVTAKLVAFAVFGTVAVAGRSLAFVLAGESATLLLVLVTIGNWRFYNLAGDTTILNLLAHFIGVYPIMLAAPFPFCRNPFFLTPVLYAGFIVFTLFVTNPLILALSFQYFEVPPAITPWVIWAILGCATILSVLATTRNQPGVRRPKVIDSKCL